MKTSDTIQVFLQAVRFKFLSAAVAPVLVGTALGFYSTGNFHIALFLMALATVVFFQISANLLNDYYDHVSGNDDINLNPTPYSGGSRVIQQKQLGAGVVLAAGIIFMTIALAASGIILYITHSLFLLLLAVVAALGSYCYTAGPLKLSYNTLGEILILFLFGILPVYAAYFLQTAKVDILPLLPAFIVGILIFLVILLNEIPDRWADAKVDKKTLIVKLGIKKSLFIAYGSLALAYVLAAVGIVLIPSLRLGLIIFILTFPIALSVVKKLSGNNFSDTGSYDYCAQMIKLHALGCTALTVGFFIQALKP